jgi:hypothetical protein
MNAGFFTLMGLFFLETSLSLLSEQDNEIVNSINPMVQGQVAPEFLEPLGPWSTGLDGHTSAVYLSLLANDPGKLWMIAFPSFEPEYALILGRKAHGPLENVGGDSSVREELVILTYVKLKKPMASPAEDQPVAEFRETDQVEIRDSGISPELAHEIEVAWRTSLRLVRNTGDVPASSFRFDGTSYHFSYKAMKGTTAWESADGVPSLLCKLANKLCEVAIMKQEQRGNLLDECGALAREITRLNSELLKRITASGVETIRKGSNANENP